MTTVNDIVLIHFEGNPLTFARIEAIDPDIKRDWHHVKLLLLQVPLQVVTWILRDIYINGEIFTMDGKEMRMERVVCPPEEDPRDEEDTANTNAQQGPDQKNNKTGKVISLSDLKKK